MVKNGFSQLRVIKIQELRSLTQSLAPRNVFFFFNFSSDTFVNMNSFPTLSIINNPSLTQKRSKQFCLCLFYSTTVNECI